MSKLTPNAPHADHTYRIIGAAMAIHHGHGPGHREVSYHQAMKHQLTEPPFELTIEYEPDLCVEDETGRVVCVDRPDLRVEQRVLTELKAQTHPVTNDDVAQVIDDFAACLECEVALLINFGRLRLEWKRLFPPKHLQQHRRRKWGPAPR